MITTHESEERQSVEILVTGASLKVRRQAQTRAVKAEDKERKKREIKCEKVHVANIFFLWASPLTIMNSRALFSTITTSYRKVAISKGRDFFLLLDL